MVGGGLTFRVVSCSGSFAAVNDSNGAVVSASKVGAETFVICGSDPSFDTRKRGDTSAK